jgi:D-glycero-alpha-D-manno-heptose-7-phosphate kinase
MAANTAAQAELHPELVGADARAVIDTARECGALGWKVNGAGGDGGSVTLLCGPDLRRKRRLLHEVEHASELFRVIPTRLSRHGLRVWRS